MKSALTTLAAVLAAACFSTGAFMANGASAQANPGAFTADQTMSYGRDADNINDQIKGYNDLFSGNKKGPLTPDEQVTSMGTGINIIGGYDAYWDGGQTQFKDDDFAKVRAAGFQTVRVPLFAFKHLKADGTLDPAYLSRIDHIIDLAATNKLEVILDEHDDDECAKDTDACGNKLSNVWYDLSERYKGAPNTVMFELLNEPHDPITYIMWDSWLTDLISIVRETNPTRNVIVGPTHWNSPGDLHLLGLPPADQHIIVTFHYYDPMEFTHQGATWVGPDIEKLRGVRWTGTPDQIAAMKKTFDNALAWSVLAKRPLFLGEFGTYGSLNPNIDDRALWTKTVAKMARTHGFASAYWYFDGGFGAYDADKGQWNEPILRALIPVNPSAH